MLSDAKYIWIASDCAFQSNSFMFFRKSFEVNDITNASIDIFADSRYQLFVNGNFVGRGPAPSDPKHPTYDSYNIKEYLVKGENVVSVIVLYYGNMQGDYIRGNPELIADIDLDGKHIYTDSTWKCMIPTCWPIGSPRRNVWKSLLEIFDARNFNNSFMYAGFDDSNWSDCFELALVNPKALGWVGARSKVSDLYPRDIEPLYRNKLNINTVYRASTATLLQDGLGIFRNRQRKQITESGKGLEQGSKLPLTIPAFNGEHQYYIFDFNKEVVGRIGFGITAPAGTIVDITFREVEEKDRLQLSPATMVNWKRYIAKEGKQNWLSFESEGFRYLQLVFSENKTPVTINEVFIEEQRYDTQRLGSFTCNEQPINNLYEASLNTTQLCMHDIYTDNPAREMAPWLGDIEYVRLLGYYGTGEYALARRAYTQIFYGQEPDGRLPLAWPSGLPFNIGNQRVLRTDGKAGFEVPHHSVQTISGIYRYYEHSGDIKLLQELYDGIIKFYNYMKTRADNNLLLSPHKEWKDRWDWVDWEGLINVWAPLNMFWYICINDIINISKSLSKDSADIEKDRETLKQSIINRFYDKNLKTFVDTTDDNGNTVLSEHTLSLALRADLVPKEAVENTLEILCSGTLTDCSPVHKYHPYWAMCKHGRGDAVMRDMRTKWANMYSVEATKTIQEIWDFDIESAHSCCCQSSSAVPAYWLPAYVLGVRPTKPGFSEFIVEPNLYGLEYAKGTVPTPHGIISVSASKNGFEVTAPDGFKFTESTDKHQIWRINNGVI